MKALLIPGLLWLNLATAINSTEPNSLITTLRIMVNFSGALAPDQTVFYQIREHVSHELVVANTKVTNNQIILTFQYNILNLSASSVDPAPLDRDLIIYGLSSAADSDGNNPAAYTLAVPIHYTLGVKGLSAERSQDTPSVCGGGVCNHSYTIHGSWWYSLGVNPHIAHNFMLQENPSSKFTDPYLVVFCQAYQGCDPVPSNLVTASMDMPYASVFVPFAIPQSSAKTYIWK